MYLYKGIARCLVFMIVLQGIFLMDNLMSNLLTICIGVESNSFSFLSGIFYTLQGGKNLR